MSYYSSVPHECTDSYKLSVFYGVVTLPTPVGNAIFLFFSSTFPACLCPPSCLPPQFFTATCPHLSAGLGYDVRVLPYSSVTSCYSYCLYPSCYLIFLGLILSIKMEVPLMFWVIHWLFAEPSYPA